MLRSAVKQRPTGFAFTILQARANAANAPHPLPKKSPEMAPASLSSEMDAGGYFELRRSKNASCGRSMRPTFFILRFDSFWLLRCLSLRS